MIRKLFRIGQRQLHTIISRETIKPSSPTPLHLKTYNLSVFDQISPRTYMPILLFYPNYDQSSSTTHHKSHELKRSLSQSLTQFYPFAGKLSPQKTVPNIDCNDEGAVFLEARNELPLNNFLTSMEQDETFDQLFPNGLIWGIQSTKDAGRSNNWTSPLYIQLNHFACGGVAVAVSMSHKIADACTLCNFLNHWASMTRSDSNDHKDVLATKPHLISYPSATVILPEMEIVHQPNLTTKRFVFPNSKLNNLKLKVQAMVNTSTQAVPNLTRVEVLNWLLYKCAVAAATKTNLGSFKPSGLLYAVNLRNKIAEQLPQTTFGNIVYFIDILTTNESEVMPDVLISRLQKEKKQLSSLRNMQAAWEMLAEKLSTLGNESVVQETFNNFYLYSSICRLPIYQVDFGWGRPARVTFAYNGLKRDDFLLMDTPDEDGIEAHVTLSKEDMAIFQNDKDILEFC